MLENKLHEELMRHKAINKYGSTMIMEQDAPLEEPAAEPAVPTDAPADPAMEMPADPALDASLPPADGAMGDVPAPPAPGEDMSAPAEPGMEDDSTEEIDITDLVNMTKSIKKQMDASKDDSNGAIQKMDSVFSKLSELEGKLGEMDTVLAKIDELGAQIQQVKPKTPEEKLNMRSLDSYPFNEKPQEFFAHKQGEMRQSGKNEYVLTKDDVENYGKDEIMKSFNPDLDNAAQY
jgi:hypothetical protein